MLELVDTGEDSVSVAAEPCSCGNCEEMQRMSAAGRRKLGRPSTTQKVNVTYCIHLLPCTGCSAFSCTYLLQASLSVFLSVQTTRISATWTTLGAATFIATKEPNQS